MSIKPPPIIIEGNESQTTYSRIVKIPGPNIETQVNAELENDAYFPRSGSILILELYTRIKKMLEFQKKELKDYNDKLKKAGLPLRIRLLHGVTVRNRKYVYCGRYLYKITSEGEKYIGRLENAVLRNELREKWNTIGQPPVNQLEALKYQVVLKNGKETKHVIVAVTSFTDTNFSELFKGFLYFRLS